jgi:WXG100 family type VII secretion target
VAKDLQVDPIDLHLSSAHMDVHHSELLAAHAAANDTIEAAQAGWVGASGAALLEKFADWQAATTRMTADIADHGTAFKRAAEGYVTVDGDSGQHLDEQL